MKNRIFTIILSVVLSLPIAVWAVDDTTTVNEQTPVVNTLDEDAIEQPQDIEENEYKQPLGTRKVAKKFLAAMGGVAISSFAIFFLLTVYNRIRERYSDIKTPEGETSLETPADLESAVKTFLDKTKW